MNINDDNGFRKAAFDKSEIIEQTRRQFIEDVRRPYNTDGSNHLVLMAGIALIALMFVMR